MTSSNSSPSGLPVWLIRLCKWLWKVQKGFKRLIFGTIVVDILVNVIANILTGPQLPSYLKQVPLVNWGIQHTIPMLLIGTLVAVFEALIFVIQLLPIPITNPAVLISPPRPGSSLPRWWWMALVLLCVLLIGLLGILIVGPTIWHQVPPLPDRGIGIIAGSNGLGICDGSCYFDAKRINGTLDAKHINGALKQEAVARIDAGNLSDAYQFWDWAANEDTTDAEAKIFAADTDILLNKTPRITFVVTVSLTGDQTLVDEGHDILQGSYIRQKEFNGTHPRGPQMYLLIANMGGQDSASQQTVASRILQVARTDSTFVGVTGVPFGSDDLIHTLSNHNIPMVSMAPLADATTRIPYLLSVAPTLTDEAQAAAVYVTNTLHARQVFVAFESGDPYSTALKDAFIGAMPPIAGSQSYPGGSVSDLSNIANEAVNDNADLIYFAGSPADANILLASLHSLAGSANPMPMVMGGDIIYQSIHSPTSERANFNGLLFTAFGYPDEWRLQHLQRPPFVTDYQAAFDPDKQHPGNPYSYSRAGSDTMLAYDALSLMAAASDNVLSKGMSSLTPGTLWETLNQFTATHQFPGISGQISYVDGSSTPNNKAVLVLQILPGGTRSLTVQSGTYSCASSCYKE